MEQTYKHLQLYQQKKSSTFGFFLTIECVIVFGILNRKTETITFLLFIRHLKELGK